VGTGAHRFGSATCRVGEAKDVATFPIRARVRPEVESTPAVCRYREHGFHVSAWCGLATHLGAAHVLVDLDRWQLWAWRPTAWDGFVDETMALHGRDEGFDGVKSSRSRGQGTVERLTILEVELRMDTARTEVRQQWNLAVFEHHVAYVQPIEYSRRFGFPR
jgi:hypothetical protein